MSSCKDDDNGGSAPQGPTAIFDGNLLTKTGDFTFRYDNKGRCVSIRDVYDSEDMFTINYESGKLTMEGDEIPYNVSFTRDGYISRIWLNESSKENGISYKIEGNISFNYDSDGHLVSGFNTGKYSASGYGNSYEGYDNAEAKFTWRNGNLTDVLIKESGYNTKDGNYNMTRTAAITYSDIPNEFNQWTWAQEEAMMTSDVLGFAGLLGRGSSNLASSYTETDEEHNTTNYLSTYTLNDNGSIRQERIDRNQYNYTYSLFGDDTPRSAGAKAKPKHTESGMIMKFHHDIQKYRTKLNINKQR